MTAAIIPIRTTALSVLWLCLFALSACFLLAAILGLVFRNGRWWGVARRLAITDLLLGLAIAILDRIGSAR